MEPVGNHGLACLGDEDYAAIALYMQNQGLVIDAALDAISDDFDSFFLRPGFLSASTATVLNTAINVSGGIGASALVYNNFPMLGPTVFLTPRAGWYQFGANVNMVAAGAVTANSYRRLTVSAVLSSSGPPTTLSTVADLSFDTNTAGEWLVCSAGSFYSPASRNITISARTMHGNAASGVNNMAGARTWCWFIGSGVEIGSA
jgi:hypothetical protein